MIRVLWVRAWQTAGLSFLFATCVTAQRTSASTLYLEVGGGAAQIHGADPFFGTGAGNSGIGGAANLSLITTFTDGAAPLEVQLGVQTRYLSASAGTSAYTLVAPYPVLRLQASKIFLTLGATPWVWRRGNGNTVPSSFNMAQSSVALLGEIGFLYAVVPKFSMGLYGAGQVVSGNGKMSPQPAVDVGFLLRFYFSNPFLPGSRNHSSNEFKGWRYPFGFEMNQ